MTQQSKKPNPFERNIGKVNPLLGDDKTFASLSKTVEAESKKELGKTETPLEPLVDATQENTTRVIKKETPTTIKETVAAEKKLSGKYSVLTGEKNKTIKIYSNLLELLRLMKVAHPDCDINETASELIVDGLKKRGWLDGLTKLQESMKNPT